MGPKTDSIVYRGGRQMRAIVHGRFAGGLGRGEPDADEFRHGGAGGVGRLGRDVLWRLI